MWSQSCLVPVLEHAKKICVVWLGVQNVNKRDKMME